MTIGTILLRTTAAAALLAASISAANAQLEVTIGGAVQFSQFGYEEEDDGFFFETDQEIVIRSDGVADNGLAYSAFIELPVEGEPEDVTLHGNWGSLEFGDYHSLPDCNGALAGLHGAAHYLFELENDRGVLATEDGATFVVPGYVVENSLSGFESSLYATFCANLFTLPTYFSIGAEFGGLSGTSHATNIEFPGGYGITGVGPDPGIFINSPTTIDRLDFEARRDYWMGIFQIDQPIAVGGYNINSADGSPPVHYAISLLGGIRSGGFDQRETLEVASTTPAFPIPDIFTVYDTHFQGSFAGAYVGASLDKRIPIGPNLALIASLSGYAGYDQHSIEVHDEVTATGLGGFSYSSAATNSYSIGTLTAGTTASLGISTGGLNVSVEGGIDWGSHPVLQYQRSDVRPTLDLGFLPAFYAGIKAGGHF